MRAVDAAPGRNPPGRAELLAGRRVFATRDLAVAQDHLARLFVPQRLDVVGDGAFGVVINAGGIGSLVVTYSSFSTGVAAHSPDLANGYAVMLPVRGSSVLIGQGGASAVINGSVAGVLHYESPAACRSLPSEPVPGNGAASMTDRHDVLSVRIDRDGLERHLGRMLGAPVRQPVRFDMTMDVAGQARSWLGVLRLASDLLSEPGDPDDRPLVAVQVEQALITTLLLTQPNNYSASLRQDVGRGPEPRAVRLVRDLIESTPELPHTVASLAQEAGVSVRGLQQSFRRHAGMPPSAYLRQARLARAHRDLQAGGEQPAISVTEVALRWGFGHTGRFAARYRERYGVTPSETLRRARGEAPPSTDAPAGS